MSFQDFARFVVLPGLAFAVIGKGAHLQLAEWWRGKLLNGDTEKLYPELTVYDAANLCDTSAPDKFIGVNENIGFRTHRGCFSVEEAATLYEELLEKVVVPYGSPIPKGIRTGLWRALSSASLLPSSSSTSVVASTGDNSSSSSSTQQQQQDTTLMNMLERVRCVTDHWDTSNQEPRAPWGCGDTLRAEKMPPILRSMVARVRQSQPNVGQVRHVAIHHFPDGAPLLLPRQIHTYYGFDYFVVPLVGRGAINKHKDVEARAVAAGFPTSSPILHPESTINSEKKKKSAADKMKAEPQKNKVFAELDKSAEEESAALAPPSLADMGGKEQPTFLPKSVLTFSPSRRSKSMEMGTVAQGSWGDKDWDVLLSLGDSLQVSSSARFSWQISVRPSSWFGDKSGLVPGLRSFQYPNGVPFPSFMSKSGKVIPAEGPWSGDGSDAAAGRAVWDRIKSLVLFQTPTSSSSTREKAREVLQEQWIAAATSAQIHLDGVESLLPRDTLHDQGSMLVFICFEGASKKPRGKLRRPESIYFGEPPAKQDNAIDDDGKYSYFGDGSNDIFSLIRKAYAAADRSLSVSVMEYGRSMTW